MKYTKLTEFALMLKFRRILMKSPEIELQVLYTELVRCLKIRGIPYERDIS